MVTLRSARTWRKSMTSKSSTSVSASSTKTSATCSSAISSPPSYRSPSAGVGISHAASPDSSAVVTLRDDPQPAVVGVGVRPEPDQRDRRGHPQLHDEHAGGLVHLGMLKAGPFRSV